ncbi:outer membrane protein assembly factor BamB family protein [Teichococcus oryzae]|uniref:PQQ-binding-like beta-propeller repeat protein n=1 Tax=Teichococcus oryzae TaxID=1608942 RepID=A0A5B2TJN2_9PROT|nr:PQQ-binding-like beta-propeller repeat protein [Pseudoroseomonas oryzae]KAA2214313.1 PQQ-binding-like beta-propeller repeat protein [Pseudoroseomonas oryzae]
MNGTIWTRRAALLGGAGLLAGCSTIDSLFGTQKTKLPGRRQPVIAARRQLEVDPTAANRPLALPAPEMRDAWPQPGGGVAHAPGHPSLPGELRRAWTADAGTGSGYRRRITTGPVVAEGLVFASDAYGQITAHDLATGRRRWRFDSRPEEDSSGAVGAGFAFADGTLYVATGMAELIALDVANGEPRWRVRLQAPARGAPAVAGGRVFVPTIDSQLTAFAAEDGRQRWSYRAQVTAAVPLGLPAPAVWEDFLVAGFPSGELIALRPEDGRVLWTESLAGAGFGGLAEIFGVRGLPVIHEGRVYAMGMGGTSMAVDLRSGRRLWERELGGTASPVPVGDWLFLVGDDGTLVALGREDGRVRWISDLNAPPEGKEREDDPATFATPILAGGRLILPSSREEALLIDPSTGATTGRLRLPASTTLPGAVAQDTLVLLSDNGTLSAWRG